MATTTRRSKVKPPQQTTVLDRDLAVLRKLDMRFKGSPATERASIIDLLALTQLQPGVEEREMAWFADGYISNDHPRDAIIADKIVANTLGFAVARTDTGEILREFGKDELAKADRAIENAKPILSVDIDLDDEDEDEDPEPEADAAPVPADTDEEVFGPKQEA